MNELTNITNELSEIVKGMDVPSLRIQDRAWLKRNLAVRNSKHKDFKRAIELLQRYEFRMDCHKRLDGNP